MRRRARGYTVVELMMALAVFATGVTGIMAMQRTVVVANRHARDVTVANGIARAWLDQLAVDATVWRTNLNDTEWLGSIANAGVNGSWQLPAFSTDRAFGPRFNVFGAPDTNANDYCVHIRLTWLYPDENGGGQPGTGAIRTEVRVFWLRDGATRVVGDCTNAGASTVDAVGANADDQYHFTYHAGAVAQRPL